MAHSNGCATRDSEAPDIRSSTRSDSLRKHSLGEPRLAAVSRAVTKYWNRSHARDDAKSEVPAAQRSFAQPAACLQVRAALTPEPTKHEGRKPRASARHAVGCREELGGSNVCGDELPKC